MSLPKPSPLGRVVLHSKTGRGGKPLPTSLTLGHLPQRGRRCCALQHPHQREALLYPSSAPVCALGHLPPKGKVFVILSGAQRSRRIRNTQKRESGFFDFAAYGRFAQNDTSGEGFAGNLAVAPTKRGIVAVVCRAGACSRRPRCKFWSVTMKEEALPTKINEHGNPK